MQYDDEYPTCESTYATLRLYHSEASPKVVTQVLSLQPTNSQIAGTVDKTDDKKKPFKLSGWFFCSKPNCDSKDVRRHIDGILWQLRDKKETLAQLQSNGWQMDISCWWMSKSGHGGPTLSPEQMANLGDLGIELWFDVYFKDAPCKDSKGNIIAT